MAAPRKSRRARTPEGFEFQDHFDARLEEVARRASHSQVSTELVATPIGNYLLFRGPKANASLFFKGRRAVVDLYAAENGRTIGRGLRLADPVTKYVQPWPDESPGDSRRRWENDCSIVAATVSLLVA